MNPAWLLPEHVEDILPPYARGVESLRRTLVDLFDGYGYELVCPPLIEYLDSLLTGVAGDLDLKTFKVVDGLSGRMLGVRADITPQAARIDAHLLDRHGVARLCYAGPVLHTRPAGLLASREPFQVGVELYGHAGIEADREVLELLLAALTLTGMPQVRVSLGHVGLFRALVEAAGVDAERAHPLFRALRAKDVPMLRDLCRELAPRWQDSFLRLPELYGGVEVLDLARETLPDLPEVQHALDDLARLLAVGGNLAVDLADLRGYGYHTGMVFAAYVGGQAQAVARGGRYDGVGAIFGRARPATGFSLDLRRILDGMPRPASPGGIIAPAVDDPGLREKIAQLRAVGERVLMEFPGQIQYRTESGCDRVLTLLDGGWQVVAL